MELQAQQAHNKSHAYYVWYMHILSTKHVPATTQTYVSMFCKPHNNLARHRSQEAAKAGIHITFFCLQPPAVQRELQETTDLAAFVSQITCFDNASYFEYRAGMPQARA